MNLPPPLGNRPPPHVGKLHPECKQTQLFMCGDFSGAKEAVCFLSRCSQHSECVGWRVSLGRRHTIHQCPPIPGLDASGLRWYGDLRQIHQPSVGRVAVFCLPLPLRGRVFMSLLCAGHIDAWAVSGSFVVARMLAFCLGASPKIKTMFTHPPRPVREN